MTRQRLVLDFRNDEVVVRCLYRSQDEAEIAAQIFRCLALGGYSATAGGGGPRIRGPRPLAGPLPPSIEAGRDEPVGFLNGWAGGAWPPAPGLREAQRVSGCDLGSAVGGVEASSRRRRA
jgi:hypothetical protein